MRKNSSGAKFSIIGYLLFLVPLAITVGFSVVFYDAMKEKLFTLGEIALFLLLYVCFATLLFSLVDIIRRRLMVDRPVEQILNATERISNGDFKIKLVPMHAYYRYDDYDLIMENINKMVEELSKSEVLKSEFISNVSHEIKTPLSVILNYAKVLRAGNIDEQTKAKYLDTLVNQSQKLSNLVTNILKLNKLENQKITKCYEKVNVGELLRECVIQFEPLFEKKEIVLACEISDIVLDINKGHLEIIFNNLISNALKFTQQGGSVDITLKNHNENIIFSVKDTGCGMNKEVGKNIFEKFYQGDTSHSSEGNGLGLSLVKRVIDILGGEILVESEEGRGSVFTVKLKRENYE